jgi:hypothetical protein
MEAMNVCMRSRLRAYILIALLSVASTGIGLDALKGDALAKMLALCRSDTGVILAVDRGWTYSGGAVRIRVINGGPNDVGYGLAYQLERRQGTRWVLLSTSHQFAPRFVVRSGEKGLWQRIHIPDHSRAGRYRLRKTVQIASVAKVISVSFYVRRRSSLRAGGGFPPEDHIVWGAVFQPRIS